SVAAIEEYLEDSQDRGEIFTEESPLFLKQDGERITRHALSSLFKNQAQKLGLKGVSAHSLRKFHTTSLEDAGMPANWIKKLQGKAASVYSQPEKTGKLTVKYIECYDALRVLEKPRDKREEERLREKLERSNQENTEMLEGLRQRNEELQRELSTSNLRFKEVYDWSKKLEKEVKYLRNDMEDFKDDLLRKVERETEDIWRKIKQG
ncbi:tyrosine-type recombinase/integrase, partial [Candidatus Bathyarchaeota archaeon]|nr:tyrosine-type recombinase/integrase [Candidatus Bathyarchaeota archaeon]